MHGRIDDATGRVDFPTPVAGVRPARAGAEGLTAHRAPEASTGAAQLFLPAAAAKPPSRTTTRPGRPYRGSATWYRSDQDRHRSVHRRANPWYRRLARGLIGLTLLAAAGASLYFGALAARDYLDRDRLPPAGSEVPAIRSTSFEIRSTSPAPTLDGTLTLDAQSGAFDFVGRGAGVQAGVRVYSPDGSTVLVRRGSGEFAPPGPADVVAFDAQQATSYLIDDITADAILTSSLRRGYVEVVDRREIGTGDDERTRYDLRIDTASLADDLPEAYGELVDRALPGARRDGALPVTLTLDARDVLVGVEGGAEAFGNNWTWQRLDYSDQPFVPDPDDPTPGDDTITITDGNVD